MNLALLLIGLALAVYIPSLIKGESKPKNYIRLAIRLLGLAAIILSMVYNP